MKEIRFFSEMRERGKGGEGEGEEEVRVFFFFSFLSRTFFLNFLSLSPFSYRHHRRDLDDWVLGGLREVSLFFFVVLRRREKGHHKSEFFLRGWKKKKKKKRKRKKKNPNLAPRALDVERQHAQRRQPRPLPLGRVRDQVFGVDVRLDLAVRRRRMMVVRRGSGSGSRRTRSVQDAGADFPVGPQTVLPLGQRHPAPAHHALVDHEPQGVQHVGLVGQKSPGPHPVRPEREPRLHDPAGGGDEVGRRERDSQEGLGAPRGVPHDRLLHLHGHGQAEAGLLLAVSRSGAAAHGADALGEATLSVIFFFFVFFFVPRRWSLSVLSFSFSSLSLSSSSSLSQNLKKKCTLTHVERPAQPVAVVGPEAGRGLDVKVRVEAVHERRDRRAARVDAEHAEDRRLGEVAPGAQALVRGQGGVVDLDLLEGCCGDWCRALEGRERKRGRENERVRWEASRWADEQKRRRRRARFADRKKRLLPLLTQVLRRAVERGRGGPLPVASGLAQVHGHVLELAPGGLVVVVDAVLRRRRAVFDVVVVVHRRKSGRLVLVHRLRGRRRALSGGVAPVIGAGGASRARRALGGWGAGPAARVGALVESHRFDDSIEVFIFSNDVM